MKVALLCFPALAAALAMPQNTSPSPSPSPTPSPSNWWSVDVWPQQGCSSGGGTVQHVRSQAEKGSWSCIDNDKAGITFGSAVVNNEAGCQMTFYSDSFCQNPASTQASGTGSCTEFPGDEVSSMQVHCP